MQQTMQSTTSRALTIPKIISATMATKMKTAMTI
jgi:hypothetical protein